MPDGEERNHERVRSLAQKFAASGETDGLGGRHEEPEAATLAYSVVEIEQSCGRLIDLAEALQETREDAIAEPLAEFREELRHVIYHVRDSAYLRVVEPLDEDEPASS